MSLQAGALVGNNVRLLRPLKRGGMGSVWLAEHLSLRTQVAVKFMSDRLAQDQEYVARFAREAMASAQIKSPHVVQVFDHGLSSDGSPYIVMELLEGEDLRQRLSRAGVLGLAEAATLVVQLARGLSKAHSLGIVHRDIKPDNIYMLDQDGELFVKVLDFGIAKHASQESEGLDGMTGTGAMVGTPHYMSPEQILSARRVDHRADLWSVGVVLYRALTGQVPFQGETLGAVCIAIERGSFMPPSERNPTLPASIDGWFVRALARDPAARFSSAKELAEAFLFALSAAGQPVPSSPFRPEMSATGLPLVLPSMTPMGGFLSGATPPPSVATGSGLSRPGSMADTPWGAPGMASAPPSPQTFHGASVTQAEWKSSSRRALVAVVSGVLGVIMLVAIAVVVVSRGGADPPASDKPSSAVSPAIEAPVAALPAADPLPSTSVAPPSAPASSEHAAEASAVKASPSVKPTAATTSTGRPRRDRGF